MFLSFCGKTPRDEGAAFVAPSATVQGDVVLKPGSTVWYGAVLRGDDGTLTIGKNSNVQDNAVLHCDIGGCVTLGENVTVGHCALVHGCTVGDGSLIGMHATLLNHCVVGKNCAGITFIYNSLALLNSISIFSHHFCPRNIIIQKNYPFLKR